MIEKLKIKVNLFLINMFVMIKKIKRINILFGLMKNKCINYNFKMWE